MKFLRSILYTYLAAVSATSTVSAFRTTASGSSATALSRRAFRSSSSSNALVPSTIAFDTKKTPTTTVLNMSTLSGTDFAKAEIAKNKIVIFSKSYCPYCDRTKALFKELKVDGTVIYELDNMKNGPDIQAALLEMTGQRTVPNVFIKGKHVGGNDKVQEANKSGKLKVLLQ